MSARKPPPESVLAQAAEARAGGSSWGVVAEQVNRSLRTVSQWPLHYPGEWAAALRAADRRAINDAAAEGVLVLRQLLRSKTETTQLEASRLLVNQRLAVARLDVAAAAFAPPEPDTLARRIAGFLEEHTDEELAQLAAVLRRTPLPEHLGELRQLPGSPG